MESLEDLARKKFPVLSEAEKRMLRAASDGTVAECRRDLGGGSNPANAEGTGESPDETWPETRNVRAHLIRWLFVDRAPREQVDPKGVNIRGARITGRLDLSSINALFPLFLTGCRLEQDLDLRYAKLPLLGLAGSWTRPIGADGIELQGSLFLRNGFHAEGEVRLGNAIIGGDLTARNGTFKNPNGNGLFADGIKVKGDVFLSDGFRADGEVRLLGATIGGDLSASGGTFKNSNGDAIDASRAVVTGGVFLSDGFSAEGTVRLTGATIGGGLTANGGTFKKPNPEGQVLVAERIKVHGDVSLRANLVAEGQVLLCGAEVSGQLSVSDAWLDALDLESAYIVRTFFWRNIHKDSHSDFPTKEWNPWVNLTDARVGSLVDDLGEENKDSWPKEGRLLLDGFVYDRITAGSTDAKARLEWLRRQPDALGFRPQPYEQLIAVLRQMGHEHQVAKVAIAKQKDLRKRGDLGWLGWLRSWFLYLAVGYGYRAWLAFVWLSLLIVLGSCIFSKAHSANVLVPSDQAAYEKYENPKKRELPITYPRFHGLLYSLDVVSPFDLGQKSKWRLIESVSYWKYELYSLFQLFAGWMLLIVAAAVPAGFIKKD